MDFIWISKVLIIICLYFILNKVYKSVDWNSSKMTYKPLDILLYLAFGISAFSALIAFTVLIIVIFPSIFNYLDTREYWEQIIILLGFIAFYFFFKIKMDDINDKKQKRESLINSQNYRIRELEDKIKKDNNETSKTNLQMSRSEKLRLIAFRNVMERKKNTEK